MFIGHFGIALASKRIAPKTSLGMLIRAAQFLDVLWPVLLHAGVEQVEIDLSATKVCPLDFADYPISHSLFMPLVWSVMIGGLYYAMRRYARGAWIVSLCVLSHWFLEILVHRPDLPLQLGGEARVGLRPWTSWPASILLECLFFGAGSLLLPWFHATQGQQ
jgi:hypothetical protein